MNSMSEAIEINNTAAVPEDVSHRLLSDSSDVQTKLGHVAKFDEDNDHQNQITNFIQTNIDDVTKQKQNQFIGLNKEELKSYINDPKWKRIRYLIGILYILLLLILLVGSILLIIYSQRCPPKPKLVWYQKDVIYQIDVPAFRDSNQDGIGDIKGVIEKLKYFEKNNIKSVLIESSIFNGTRRTLTTQIDNNNNIYTNKTIDLYKIDPLVATEKEFDELIKIFNRKDMHLIIDIPLASTYDKNGLYWYGSKSPLSTKINDPCIQNQANIPCQFYKNYNQLPLDFNNKEVAKQAKSLIEYWLLNKKFDGVRVNLPLEYNTSTRSYDVSYQTINQWIQTKNDIQKKTKPKLLLFDIPNELKYIINNDNLHNHTAHSLFSFNNKKKVLINAQSLDERVQSFETNQFSKPQFWKLGSKRINEIINDTQLPKEILLTMVMLFGGTPIILYGEEIGLDQKSYPLMSWALDQPYGGFSSCLSSECKQLLSSYQINPSKTSVKRQEASGGESKDSLLNVFRHLTKLRQAESFQFGFLETGFDPQSNIFWFIREASGHRGYITVISLNDDPNDVAHISLYELTKHDVPLHVHYEYQWPTTRFPISNKTSIDSDNLLIHPQSINIFWWIPKLIKPNILSKNVKEHTHSQLD